MSSNPPGLERRGVTVTIVSPDKTETVFISCDSAQEADSVFERVLFAVKEIKS